jgi:hypothetical protein
MIDVLSKNKLVFLIVTFCLYGAYHFASAIYKMDNQFRGMNFSVNSNNPSNIVDITSLEDQRFNIDNCSQDKCRFNESSCSNTCSFAAGSMQCTSGISIYLAENHPSPNLIKNHSGGISYLKILYRDIVVKIKPRPPRTVS